MLPKQKTARCPFTAGVPTDWDERWSYVGSKAHPRWTWYLVERQSGVIVAWENGWREDAVLKRLMLKVEHLPLRRCYTDGLAV